MSNRVAVLSIIVEEDSPHIQELNAYLSQCKDYIIGRMGIPYHQQKINVISVVLDGPQDTISSLAGKIGGLKGVSAKTAFSSVIHEAEE